MVETQQSCFFTVSLKSLMIMRIRFEIFDVI